MGEWTCSDRCCIDGVCVGDGFRPGLGWATRRHASRLGCFQTAFECAPGLTARRIVARQPGGLRSNPFGLVTATLEGVQQSRLALAECYRRP